MGFLGLAKAKYKKEDVFREKIKKKRFLYNSYMDAKDIAQKDEVACESNSFSNVVEARNIMLHIRRLTHIKPIDGFSLFGRLGFNNGAIIGASWNYGNISSANFRIFSLLRRGHGRKKNGVESEEGAKKVNGTLKQDEIIKAVEKEGDQKVEVDEEGKKKIPRLPFGYGDCLCGDYNPERGVEATGRVTLCEKFPFLIRGYARIATPKIEKKAGDKKRVSEMGMEIRKVNPTWQAGPFIRSNSYGLTVLKTVFGKLSLAGELEFMEHDYKNPTGLLGARLNLGKHTISAQFSEKDQKCISIGYSLEGSNSITWGVEHSYRVESGETDSRIGFQAAISKAIIKAYFSTNLIAGSELICYLTKHIHLRASGRVDFFEKKPAVFGFGLDLDNFLDDLF